MDEVELDVLALQPERVGLLSAEGRAQPGVLALRDVDELAARCVTTTDLVNLELDGLAEDQALDVGLVELAEPDRVVHSAAVAHGQGWVAGLLLIACELEDLVHPVLHGHAIGWDGSAALELFPGVVTHFDAVVREVAGHEGVARAGCSQNSSFLSD